MTQSASESHTLEYGYPSQPYLHQAESAHDTYAADYILPVQPQVLSLQDTQLPVFDDYSMSSSLPPPLINDSGIYSGTEFSPKSTCSENSSFSHKSDG